MERTRIAIMRRLIGLLSACFFCMQQMQPATPTVPSGGAFAAGMGAIAASGKPSPSINPACVALSIGYNFSIGKGAIVKFNNGSGATLNRVTGSEMSGILGSLIASGSVYLINPQGILIGHGANINTGGDFVASTLNISNPEFMTAGALSFQGSAVTIVTNLGAIFSRNGSIFLIAQSVNNAGVLQAPNGSVGLAAGSRILLKDSTTDQRLFVSAAGGDVTNTGVFAAAQVELKTKGGNIYALAGNNGGQISATGTANIDGKVWLVAESGTTNVTGIISAQNANATGGSIG